MRTRPFNKDTDIREYRRKLIVRLHEKSDLNQTEIGEILECSQGRVSQVLQEYHGGGEEELRPVPHKGAKSKLTGQDKSRLKTILDKGAKAQGFLDGL